MNSAIISMLAFVAGVKNRMIQEEKGATAVEYGLMVALIAIAIIVAVTLLGTNLSTMFTTIATRIGAIPIP
ncbi:Flp family type IVb pilin [Paenarthrobacter sp. Z7-10]|uniref:Flp family type IVb pilin n=1 Tax=Paenarthrobacter sp. Z7-10 TaxID=2787635 RepID=UPI0022A9673B|nr:Flp family type IVb pilin [Paenarthrobacter sp. Z7-10]MCZ2403969.1 Flp family type IVb pilin [Paenarthrobacter sp. Z7-10]